MNVAAITGYSGAGKTTLLVQLIARYVAQGRRVGAIKHTHHHLNEENRGDTARFRAAGADPVILAGPGQAVIFRPHGTERVPYERPRDLLAHFDHDIVLVEGFKELGDWPKVSISDDARPTVEELAANLDRIWRSMAEAPRYRAVLFDLDGTLVDSYAALTEAVNHARRSEGLHDLTPARIRDLVGDGLDMLLQRAFERTEIEPHTVAAFESRYGEVCCEESRVLADVEATLEELASRGILMGVCTNKPTFFSKKILDFLELSRYFRAIVGPDLAGARKPEARHLLVTLAAVQCSPGETLFVGDMPIDVLAARNSGVAVAVVASGSSSREQLVAAQPDHFLERFSDLVKLI